MHEHVDSDEIDRTTEIPAEVIERKERVFSDIPLTLPIGSPR